MAQTTQTPAAAHAVLLGRFELLKLEFPTVTFGYIGNCGVYRSGPYDDRRWYIFLPHHGRVGGYSDRVGGYSTESLGNMLADWDRLVGRVRLAMAGRS